MLYLLWCSRVIGSAGNYVSLAIIGSDEGGREYVLVVNMDLPVVDGDSQVAETEV